LTFHAVRDQGILPAGIDVADRLLKSERCRKRPMSTQGITTMSLLRSGASRKYSDNWAAAFGKSGSKKKSTSSTKSKAKKSQTKSRKKSTKK
jgi:hypothetical protein